jgi:hypothetical protein
MKECNNCGCLIKHQCVTLSRMPESKWVQGHTGRIEKIKKKYRKPIVITDLEIIPRPKV